MMWLLIATGEMGCGSTQMQDAHCLAGHASCRPALDRGSGEVGVDALMPDLDSRESLSWGAAGGERAPTSRRADPAEAALHPDYVRRVWHADPKARRLDERFSMSMATPPTGGWFHDAGERVFIKDEIAPSRTFASIAAGGEHLYLDDEGRPISYDFDPSASNLHPLDVEATKELERLDAGIESALKGGGHGGRRIVHRRPRLAQVLRAVRAPCLEAARLDVLPPRQARGGEACAAIHHVAG